MKSMHNRLLAIAGLILGSAICATATPIIWTFQDVQFSGGPVTGSFEYDADLNRGYNGEAGVVLSSSVTTPDGLSYTDPFGFFTIAVPHLIFSTPTNGVNLSGTSWVWVDTNGDLTDAGGIVPITEASEQLCMSPGCGDASVIANTFSGELVGQSSIPEPSAALLGAFGLLTILWMRVSHKQKGELSKTHCRKLCSGGLLVLVVLWLGVAATAYGQTDPWSTAAGRLATEFTGPIAKGFALVAIVVGGLETAFSEGGSRRTWGGIVLGLGAALGAAQFVAWLFS